MPLPRSSSSPLFDSVALGERAFGEQCRERAVLVLTGATDNRVPLHYVKSAIAEMSAAGARVELKTFALADHFLIFSERSDVIDGLATWCAGR